MLPLEPPLPEDIGQAAHQGPAGGSGQGGQGVPAAPQGAQGGGCPRLPGGEAAGEGGMPEDAAGSHRGGDSLPIRLYVFIERRGGSLDFHRGPMGALGGVRWGRLPGLGPARGGCGARGSSRGEARQRAPSQRRHPWGSPGALPWSSGCPRPRGFAGSPQVAAPPLLGEAACSAPEPASVSGLGIWELLFIYLFFPVQSGRGASAGGGRVGARSVQVTDHFGFPSDSVL